MRILGEWQRTGNINATIKENKDTSENLEGAMQYWLVEPNNIKIERFDAFFYCPVLKRIYINLKEKETQGLLELKKGTDFSLVEKLSSKDKKILIDNQTILKYIEIGDVTPYGLITRYITGTYEELPTRGEYQVQTGDILLALNNSSRGTVVLVPEEFNNMICTSGFLVIRPKTTEEGILLWYCLRSEICRKQIYYLSQTASQPELKIESWNKYFRIPFPVGEDKKNAIKKANQAFKYIEKLSDVGETKFEL